MNVDEPRDPRERARQEPMPAQQQEPPGSEARMEPRPDYGEASYRGSGRLQGRAALITGGDSGIGRAVALAFAREGADVLISYLSEHEDAKETARVVEESGRACVPVAGDIADEAHCQALVRRTLEEFGRLDILVNNAGYQQTHERIEEVPSEEWDRIFRINIYAMFYLCKAALPVMRPGGAIINTSSIQSAQPKPVLLPYATTKGAIKTFTEALAQEAIERGIRVNAVAPGPVWTPLIPISFPPDKVAEFGQDNPMGRPAQPAELAPVYVFLASDDASYVAGMTYGVTGGKLLL
jgi:NAD(P)-dependent dehydrogenase (short-subunit alcohol dehydrogenase family)